MYWCDEFVSRLDLIFMNVNPVLTIIILKQNLQLFKWKVFLMIS